MAKRILSVILVLMMISALTSAFPVSADSPETTALRRPVSPESPMWIVHIDTWNNADPDKIIDLVPEDIKPYVVFNISLSVNWDSEKKRFMVAEYGYEIAKSWLRTCAERGVWAFVQPASGGPCHLPDYDPAETDYEETVFAEFFRDYQSFLGFNYCEQFWGFEQEDFPVTPVERYKHFAGLLQLCHKYGGYLVDSWCGNQWGQSLNPLAMIKNVPEFEEAARLYPENFILLEKYTQTGYIDDVESLVLGTYLSGYCGNFGVRYDETGWTDESGEGTGGYVVSTGLPVHFERLVLNGATVIDGPELVPEDDFYEDDETVDKNGYTIRNWAYYNQFYNVMIDLFRKTLDGTFRIPSREEVIDRTKIIIINDITSGDDDSKYCTPNTLFEGLYKMEGDGNLRDNHTFYKSTGRYPTIPEAPQFADPDLESRFEKIVRKTEYRDIWADIDSKVADFDEMFPEEDTGDIYAARRENVWVTYNPYKHTGTALGVITPKYNTCESIALEYPRYSNGLIKETADHLSIYLNNYNEDDGFNLKTDVITISGASSEPTFEYTDRGINCLPSKVTGDYSGSTFTLKVEHNGPVQIEIDCSGSASGRLTEASEAVYAEPSAPPQYLGTLQYEGEFFDRKGEKGVAKNAAGDAVRNYTGQGYIILGQDKGASVRDTVRAPQSGKYTLKLKYSVLADTEGAALSVNGFKASNLSFTKSDGLSDWQILEIPVKLKKGDNKVDIKLTSDLADMLYIDNFTLDLVSEGAYISPITMIIIAAAVIVIIIIVLVIILSKKKKKN